MEQEKKCGKCKETKPLSEFYVRRDAPNATHRSICKSCNYARTRAYPRLRELQDAWREKNRDRVNAQSRSRTKRNPERRKSANSAWLKRHLPEHAERVRARYASQKNATPRWADKEKIMAFYREARRRTVETGVRHDVDHIIPLVHPLVCGLHVESNLQVLSIFQNSAKRNFYSP